MNDLHKLSVKYTRGQGPVGGFGADTIKVDVDGKPRLLQRLRIDIDAANFLPALTYTTIPDDVAVEFDAVLLTGDLDPIADKLEKLPLGPEVLGVDVFADRLRRLADRICPREA
jgi:hypothetical protein